ncbi:uncharacterized protein LOC114317774 [Camellia sinensis]|uniref:uncharacterized protein LOC114317774 n=1 Tax=Camellia sinensis TaxID=4442 RepID=UPI001036818E|nr:uncharacterized protein LOC114317774 [Camellia sinensis]
MSQRGLFDMNSINPEIEPYMSQQLEDNIMLRDEEVGWDISGTTIRGGIKSTTIRGPLVPPPSDQPLQRPSLVAPLLEEASQRPPSEGPLVLPHRPPSVAPQQLSSTQAPRLPLVRSPSVAALQLSSRLESSSSQPIADPLTSSQPTSGHVSSSSTSTRRGKGCAKAIKEWGTGTKLDIQFDKNYCPIGNNVSKLTTQLGIIVHNGNIVLLTFLDWITMPDNIIDNIWKDVKDNLNVCPEEYKPICMKTCNSI